MQLHEVISDILKNVERQRNDRSEKIHLVSEAEREQLLHELRMNMFARSGDGQAFQELTDTELALIEEEIERYLKEKRFIVSENSSDDNLAAFHTIRRDLLLGKRTVSPDQFRAASNFITQGLVHEFIEKHHVKTDSSFVLLPWRAALAFADAFQENGFEHFYHLGAKRNEETLATEIYYQKKPRILTDSFEQNADLNAIIADPMLATGNTMDHAINDLLSLGIKESNIHIISVISAPEGVDHLLSTFPKTRIMVGQHDEKLNSNGFILPGLGDFGDKYFENFDLNTINKWEKKGIVKHDAVSALHKKLASI